MVGRLVIPAVALAVLVMAAGCAPPAVETETVNNPLFSGGSGSNTIYVDALLGVDASGHGSAAAPYQTIHYAFTQATSGVTVQVAPGTYNTSTGESFPLNVPAGVTLRGDETTKGSSTTVNDSGPQATQSYVFTAGADSVIAGFTIHNPASSGSDNGVFVNASNVVLRNNTVYQMSGAGIYIQGGSSILISDNLFDHNVLTAGSIGLAIFGGGAIVVENNTFSTNLYGVDAEATDVDFGAGNHGGSGGNVFSCNTAYDVYTSLGPGSTIEMPSNTWGPNPPQINSPGGATVNTAPAISISPVCS